MSRRGFLGVAAAGLAGVLLAPGIRLIEIAQASPQNIEALQNIADVGAWKTQTYGQSLLSALENL